MTARQKVQYLHSASRSALVGKLRDTFRIPHSKHLAFKHLISFLRFSGPYFSGPYFSRSCFSVPCFLRSGFSILSFSHQNLLNQHGLHQRFSYDWFFKPSRTQHSVSKTGFRPSISPHCLNQTLPCVSSSPRGFFISAIATRLAQVVI